MPKDEKELHLFDMKEWYNYWSTLFQSGYRYQKDQYISVPVQQQGCRCDLQQALCSKIDSQLLLHGKR
jgi:hypothetical protein